MPQIEPLGGEFEIRTDEETILALVNKIDELIRECNSKERRIEFLEHRANTRVGVYE